MPALRVNSAEITDGKCSYKVGNRDVHALLDFEMIFNVLDEKTKMRLGQNKRHCDVIVINSSSVQIYELSMNTSRDIEEYLDKFEYCVKFLEYLNKSGIQIGLSKIELVTVVHKSIVNEFNHYAKVFRNVLNQYKRNILMKYSNALSLVPKVCNT